MERLRPVAVLMTGLWSGWDMLAHLVSAPPDGSVDGGGEPLRSRAPLRLVLPDLPGFEPWPGLQAGYMYTPGDAQSLAGVLRTALADAHAVEEGGVDARPAPPTLGYEAASGPYTVGGDSPPPPPRVGLQLALADQLRATMRCPKG